MSNHKEAPVGPRFMDPTTKDWVDATVSAAIVREPLSIRCSGTRVERPRTTREERVSIAGWCSARRSTLWGHPLAGIPASASMAWKILSVSPSSVTSSPKSSMTIRKRVLSALNGVSRRLTLCG